jgi:hypothetical protein
VNFGSKEATQLVKLRRPVWFSFCRIAQRSKMPAFEVNMLVGAVVQSEWQSLSDWQNV